MGVEKVRKDDTARTFEFLFRFNRVWINSRLLLVLLLLLSWSDCGNKGIITGEGEEMDEGDGNEESENKC